MGLQEAGSHWGSIPWAEGLPAAEESHGDWKDRRVQGGQAGDDTGAAPSKPGLRRWGERGQ